MRATLPEKKGGQDDVKKLKCRFFFFLLTRDEGTEAREKSEPEEEKSCIFVFHALHITPQLSIQLSSVLVVR